ncbi:MAG: hypothetical protein M3Q22_09470 [Actinomycetota bacterium]|nr:hypothetical protein [Actinomycetota bacterium]
MLEEVDGVAAWQEDLGYLLLPGNPLHVAFLFRGDGRNGKGVLMDVMRALVGPGAVSSLSLEDMVSDRARFRLVGLVGSALNPVRRAGPESSWPPPPPSRDSRAATWCRWSGRTDPFDYRP